MYKPLRDLYWWVEYHVVGITLILLFCGMLLALAWVLLRPSPPHHSLTKTEWTCTETKVEKHVRFQATGKVTVPISTSREVCVSYKRNH